MNNFRFNEAINYLLELSSGLNREFEINKPWLALKEGNNKRVEKFLNNLIERYFILLNMLNVFIPSINNIMSKRYVDQNIMKVYDSNFSKIL